MKTSLTAHHEIIFNSELTEVLGFTKKNYPADTHSSEKPTNKTDFDEILLKWNCGDGSIAMGRLESFFLFQRW